MTASESGGIRLGGLTSGFDTESIVQQLLSVDQARIDRLKEEQELNLAKIDTWNDVAEQLRTFASAVTTLRADGTTGSTLYDDKSATSSTEATATASAASSAINAEYALNVTTLARAHVAYGSQKATTYTLPSAGTIILGGASISLASGDTLSDIASKINSASYVSGKEMNATVIDERLVIQTAATGASQSIHGTVAGAPPFVNATDDPNNILQGELGIIDGAGNLVNEAQTAADASFTVNGISITRESNTVTDVITGVTMNLLQDGGATTTITVSHDTTAIKNALTDFIETFNETRDFIDRVRNATLEEDDEFGLFFSDSLMRQLYNNTRALTTTGVTMGDADWDGSITAAAAAASATSITINNFSNATGTISEGDQFVISGDSTIYTVLNTTSIAANSATIDLDPPLTTATTGGESVSVAVRSLEDFGLGVRTDTVSGIDGIIGILDEGQLDGILSSNVDLIRTIFTRTGDTDSTTGVARRLYDWIDDQTRISLLQSKTRAIDDTRIDSLTQSNSDLDEQIARLEDRMVSREEALIRQFANMENAMAQAQSAGSAIAGLGGGGQ